MLKKEKAEHFRKYLAKPGSYLKILNMCGNYLDSESSVRSGSPEAENTVLLISFGEQLRLTLYTPLGLCVHSIGAKLFFNCFRKFPIYLPTTFSAAILLLLRPQQQPLMKLL
jgi:hypothetical protein